MSIRLNHGADAEPDEIASVCEGVKVSANGRLRMFYSKHFHGFYLQ